MNSKEILVTRLAEYIEANVDNCTSDYSLASAAKHLSVSTRTLQRRLRDSHTTYRKIQDEVLKTRCKALVLSGMPISKVSAAVGLSCEAALYRAFKRWTGMTPTKFLRNHADKSKATAKALDEVARSVLR